MKKDMPLEGLRWSRDSGSALYDTPQNGRSRTGWGANISSCLAYPIYVVILTIVSLLLVKVLKFNKFLSCLFLGKIK